MFSICTFLALISRFLAGKESVRACLEKMREIQQLSPLEIVEMLVTLFCLLKDSSLINAKLLEDFERNGGYEFLQDFLVKYVCSLIFAFQLDIRHKICVMYVLIIETT